MNQHCNYRQRTQQTKTEGKSQILVRTLYVIGQIYTNIYMNTLRK